MVAPYWEKPGHTWCVCLDIRRWGEILCLKKWVMEEKKKKEMGDGSCMKGTARAVPKGTNILDVTEYKERDTGRY